MNIEQLKQKFEEIKSLIKKTDEKCNLKQNEQVKQELETYIKQVFIEYPEILTIQDNYGMNLGMYTAIFDMEQATLIALDNHEASIQQNILGYNIGMCAAAHKLPKATLKALDNPVASVQQDDGGLNIGMHAARYGNEDAVLKALDNPVASVQQDVDGLNMAMYALYKKLTKAIKKSLQNTALCRQKNHKGQTFVDMYQEVCNTLEM